MDSLGAPTEVRFRRSRRRVVASILLFLLGAWGLTVLLLTLVFGADWTGSLFYLSTLLGITVAGRRRLRGAAGLPLVLDGRGLRLIGPGGEPVAVDWTDLAEVRVRGRLDRKLVVELTENGNTRPESSRWQWPRVSRGSSTRVQLTVPLLGVSPGVGRLRRELAARHGAARQVAVDGQVS
ncbi:hypothetical protein ABT336_22830 [Micromonospora sp. NPDC000207]|uniref:hypothetical protein n=1 Tax=Micromonospora sp. NPDC000207 TaxID=3154246 RepID=UPI00331D4CE9